MHKDLTIIPLTAEHAGALSAMIFGDSEEYRRHFTPFSFDEASLADRLRRAKRDCYWGIHSGSALTGFFMLRGFDEGYERPSFGVYLAEHFSGAGLAKLALQYTLSWCCLNAVPAVMLKVHASHPRARKIYEEMGFTPIGTCPTTGQAILEKHFPSA